MNEKKFKGKLLEFLMESSKPKKYEVGFVQGNRIVNDGLVILGMNATDILGFAKPENERRIRKVRGVQAWFKNMYENGWRYNGTFEQEGLLNNGFVVMERELPNKVLDAIREELEILLRNDEGEKYIHVPNPDILKGMGNIRSLPKSLEEMKPMSGYVGDDMLRAEGKIPKAVKEPREGFESDVNDFMLDAKKEMKTAEELFFDETGKNAIWRGKETIAFKEWQKKVMSD